MLGAKEREGLVPFALEGVEGRDAELILGVDGRELGWSPVSSANCWSLSDYHFHFILAVLIENLDRI